MEIYTDWDGQLPRQLPTLLVHLLNYWMVTVDCTITLCITLLERHLLLLNHTKTQRQENNLQKQIC